MKASAWKHKKKNSMLHPSKWMHFAESEYSSNWVYKWAFVSFVSPLSYLSICSQIFEWELLFAFALIYQHCCLNLTCETCVNYSVLQSPHPLSLKVCLYSDCKAVHKHSVYSNIIAIIKSYPACKAPLTRFYTSSLLFFFFCIVDVKITLRKDSYSCTLDEMKAIWFCNFRWSCTSQCCWERYFRGILSLSLSNQRQIILSLQSDDRDQL